MALRPPSAREIPSLLGDYPQLVVGDRHPALVALLFEDGQRLLTPGLGAREIRRSWAIIPSWW